MIKPEINNYWVAEYSSRQKCFHVELVEGMVQTNLKIIARRDYDSEPGFICIGVFETQNEAHARCSEVRKALARG